MAYQYADPSPTAPGAQSPGAVAAPAYAAAPPAQYAAPYGYGYGYPPYVDPNELRTLFLTGKRGAGTLQGSFAQHPCGCMRTLVIV
jgi:hypothetical protein